VHFPLAALPDGLWKVALLSMTPASELSVSIPYGYLVEKLPLWPVVLTALLFNWVVVPIMYVGLHFVLQLLQRWKWFDRHWDAYCARLHGRMEKSVARWGSFAVFLFIAVPGPGSGLYTASVVAYLLGIGMRRFIPLAIAGQLVAAAIVVTLVLTGSGLVNWVSGKH
jgi:uncharacterized membrane protein